MTVVPNEFLVDGQLLTADGLVDLYEISLRNVASPTYIRFMDGTPGNQTAYKGLIWDHIPVKMTGISRSSEEEKSRPSITAMNPEGLWNLYAAQGLFDRAVLQRFRVLKTHLDANVNIYQTQIWFVGRVTQVITNQGITLELRGLSDGPDQLLPVRMYIPPEFPFVTLK